MRPCSTVGSAVRWTRRSGPIPGVTGLLFTMLLFLAGAADAQAQHAIAGRVTADLGGEPLSGVEVRHEGGQAATLTDADGRYRLVVPSTSGALVFSLLGYGTTRVEFDGQTVLNVTMSISAVELEGMVVIGYGEKSRLTLTESVGTVSDQQITATPIASPEVALQGRISGVQVSSQSGAPGAPVSVRIRGIGTVGNTQPLFVVDGIPVGRGSDPLQSPLATMNPNDIESISVLKDASAAAVYGVQSANGVVLITTKRGQFGKPTIRYDGYMGIQRMPKTYDMLTTAEWLQLTQAGYDNYNEQYGYTPDQGEYQELHPLLQDPSLMSTTTDWQDAVIDENAPIMNHNLSISGASEAVNYYISGGYFDQEAVIDRWDLSRYNFRANSDFRVTDRIRMGETFSLSYQNTLFGNNNGFNGQLLRNALTLPPFFRFRDEDGSIPGNRYGFTGNPEFADAGVVYGNEPGLNQITENKYRRTRVLGGLYGEIDIIEGLTLRSQGNADYGVERNNRWQPSYTRAEIGLDREETATEQRLDNWGLVWTNTATFTRAFGAHDLAVMAGVEAQKYGNTGTQVEATDFLTFNEDFRRIVPAGSSLLGPPGGWAGESAFLGFMGRLSYDYADRYLLTASVRRDGASNFARENRWGTFPSFSAGWRISEESFFEVPWMNELKLRGSWGQLGNSSIPGAEYPHIFRVTTTPDYGLNGSQVVKAPVPAGFVNPDLIWETNEMMDFGVETVLFDGMVDLAATYYRRDTEDFLVPIELPALSGFSIAPVNGGLVRNQGFEVELGWAPPQFIDGLALNLRGNLTTVDNELVSLPEGIDSYAPVGLDDASRAFAQYYRTEVGQPIGYLYGYRTCGIYQTAEAAAAAPQDVTASERPQAGDLCFMDINSRDADGNLVAEPDGVINADDRTYLGKTIPDFYFGLNLNAIWRQFDVGAFFNGVGGVQAYNEVRRNLEVPDGGSQNRSREALNYWTPENSNTDVPRAFDGDPNNNNRFSDRWVEDAGFLRLRSLQIGYTFREGLLGIPANTRIYLAGSNLFTITDYRGLDPEFTTSIDFVRSQNQVATFSGTDTGNIPQPRTFQFGVSTSF